MTEQGVSRVFAWGAQLMLYGVLLLLLVAGGCNKRPDQYEELGKGLGQQVKEGGVPKNYQYVADIETKQYWPNQLQYEQAIPTARRVYIKDAEALSEFKGYAPGPL